ncbi:hypothetical protein HMI54_013548 [Coelomomyces lativittatus]|nr:hypothetical protein HMI54_013548 [Coelomomyces lativittatus]
MPHPSKQKKRGALTPTSFSFTPSTSSTLSFSTPSSKLSNGMKSKKQSFLDRFMTHTHFSAFLSHHPFSSQGGGSPLHSTTQYSNKGHSYYYYHHHHHHHHYHHHHYPSSSSSSSSPTPLSPSATSSSTTNTTSSIPFKRFNIASKTMVLGPLLHDEEVTKLSQFWLSLSEDQKHQLLHVEKNVLQKILKEHTKQGWICHACAKNKYVQRE